MLVSLALHALAALLLGRVERARATTTRTMQPMEIAVISRPPARSPSAPPRREERAPPPPPETVRKAGSRAVSPPAVERPVAPRSEAMMRMRPPAAEVVAPAAPPKRDEVFVPPPWSVGAPQHAPSTRELPPGALLGPVRAPGPRLPGADATRERLGPNVVGDGDGGYREDHITFRARVDRDGAVHFKDKGDVGMDSPFSGHFDLTDAVMRAMGDDPYIHEKLAFMERTREAREGMAVADRSARIREAMHKLPAYLDKIWAQERWKAAERRRLLFALWEEAAEDGDAELVRAGGAARRTIESWVRRRLPEGSADAYPAAELDELNRRSKSRERFDPYGVR